MLIEFSVMRKALDYMESFNRYASEDATQAVERYMVLIPKCSSLIVQVAWQLPSTQIRTGTTWNFMSRRC